MGGMVSLWGASSLIESIQYGTIALSGVQTSNTATITSVDLSRAIIIDLRQSNNWNGGTQPAYTSNTLALTNSTTVTAFRNATGGIALTAAFAVVQVAPGVVKSIQSGRVSGNGTVTVTITGVNTAKTFLLSLGLEGDSGGRDDAFYAYMSLTNSTTITFTRGVGAGTGQLAGWIAVEGF
jgi:hypothetical protein